MKISGGSKEPRAAFLVACLDRADEQEAGVRQVGMPIGATCLAYPNLSKLEGRLLRQWSREVAIADQAIRRARVGPFLALTRRGRAIRMTKTWPSISWTTTRTSQ